MRHFMAVLLITLGFVGIAHKRSGVGFKQFKARREAIALDALRMAGE